MSEVQYRHWQPGDDAGVMRILAPMGWCTPERYAAKFDDPGLRPEGVLVAERAGRIVGHLMLPHRRLRFGGATLPFGGVGQVVVDPEARGEGIGSRLLTSALAHHRAAGAALAGLFTLPSLVPAYEMYRRHGFVPVTHRTVLRVPLAALPAPAGLAARPAAEADRLAALPAPAGLAARPAAEADRPALARLLDDWATEHAGVSVEAAEGPLDGQRLVTRADGAIVGRVEVADRPEGRRVQGGLLAAKGVSVAVVLAAALAGETAEALLVVTNVESRVYAELAGMADGEQRDGAVLMFACLGLARALAGLSVEMAGRLRQAGAPPLRATLLLAETGERVGLDWDGKVLTVADPPDPAPPTIVLSAEALVPCLCGQPAAPPDSAPSALWSALFPPLRAEMRLVDCW